MYVQYMKRSSFDLEDHLALIGGLLFIAFAAVTFFAANGHTQVLIYILEGIGVIAVIGGFLIASFAGAICAFIAIAIVVKLMEKFTLLAAVMLLVGGMALIAYWMKENKIFHSAKRKSASSRSSSAASKGSGEERPKSIFGEFQGKPILEEFEFHGVDANPFEEGRMKVGSEVTIRTDEKEDSFEFICAGIVIGEIGNQTYEQMKRRARYIKMIKEGRRMVITSIEKSLYAVDMCNLYVGII